jgi:predicted DNA-binding transcriptional regulator AlpA
MAPATLAAAQAEAAQKSTPPTQEMSAKPATAPPEKSAQQVKKVRVGGPERSSESKAPAPVKDPPLSFAVDDWWTTPAVCAFLKIGRKALWNMRRDPASDFPAPVDAVGHRHLYLAAEVRAWMDAQRETARQRAQHRRDAMRQFRDSPRGSGAGTQVT